MDVSELEAAVRMRDATAIIELRGEVNAGADSALEAAYAQATTGGAASMVLDFARADYINSSGIALIVALLARARAQRIGVAAIGLSDHYREIFEITRLADFMTIADNEDGAISAAEGSTDA
jgi:anti-anti-sigma factor